MEQLSSRQVYTNNWMTVREDSIRREDGSAGLYGVVDKPDYALVIPYEDGRFHLVEQFRYPLGIRRWEFPQGTAPERADVEPAELAARELREETGLAAGDLVEIGKLDVAPGLSSQRGRIFLATDLTHGEPQREHEEQDMRASWFERTKFEGMITAGEITDAQSVAAYALLQLWEQRS
ncbi:NUDIX domain-containing protein [Prauserella alba]|uniref:NUDIX hydrolase n=1 Tax=Prauserella alba TaxID=176898 RepID=A0ABP4G8P9_9PSEU|nr:NUDIX hydrolase [Prauserella alba]MCP2180757.1 NUDIX domain-containing protein [Prauserella alba]